MDEIIKTTTQSSSDNSSFWLMIGTLYLNTSFFKKGVVILSPTIPEESICDSDTSFTINARKFSLYNSEGTHSHKPHTGSLNTAKTLITRLTAYTSETSQNITYNTDQSILFNQTRREEIFLPIQIESESTYIYPWTAKSIKKFDFNGFKQFVTVGCMFGSKLQGITNDGEFIELINHNLTLRPHQQITSIAYDHLLKSPYEEVIFHEFEKNCALAMSLTTQNESTQLLYHLPAQDYILFGIKLALQQKMSLTALKDFIDIIIAHKHEYQNRLMSIADAYHIDMKFNSPFMHLLEDDIDLSTDGILSQLYFSHCSSEKEFVDYCIVKLTDHNPDNYLSLIWQDFLHSETSPPESIEDLFKIGNAVLSASASIGQDDYQTCSLLPLSEKQIQLQYEQCRKKISTSNQQETRKYPAQFNITTLDPVITYSPTTQGLLFYFSHSLSLLATLITEKKLLSKASSHLRFFHTAETDRHLDELHQQFKGIR